ncbi:hypothetical protein JMM81_17120 [Bacillus sp. V3B]|uniref:hypothetical protein n=1 Tax=Bacillus sp. V3B TaxID=2804915 RepID=UPI00210D0E6C|nr:hypothetical protein [Bacillus sp. V3B]MCQ6276637.1 hypothetical protein [Bacillus sp. V3B]
MKKLSFILCSLVFVFAVLPIISGAFNETANSSENQRKEEKIYNNQLSKAEKQQQEKELEEFLKKENKPNALLPLPNPEDKLNFNGIPLPDGEKVEPKNIY